MLYVWHKMTFAKEPLTLLLYKPLLKCFASRLCLLVEGIEPAVLVPEALKQAEESLSRSDIQLHITRFYTPLELANSLWEMKNDENKNNRNLQNHLVV